MDHGNVSRSAMDLLGVFFNMESYLDLGLIEAVIDECVFGNPKLTVIDGGMDQLPRSFHKHLDNDIRYSLMFPLHSSFNH